MNFNQTIFFLRSILGIFQKCKSQPPNVTYECGLGKPKGRRRQIITCGPPCGCWYPAPPSVEGSFADTATTIK